MIIASVGIGKGDDATYAGKDAANLALSSLANKRADCALVFASSSLNQEQVLKGVMEVLGNIPIVGCSSAFEISSEAQISENSVVILVVSSDQIKLSTGFGNHLEWNPRQSAKDCVQTLDQTAKIALIFANFLSIGSESAISLIKEKLDPNTTIISGGASDDYRYYNIKQYFKSSTYIDSIVALSLSGMFSFAFEIRNGFLPVGILKKITKIKDNKIIEIDNKPATSLYEEYFGDEYNEIIKQNKLMTYASSYPLGIYEEGSVKPVLRLPIHIDIDSGEIHCGGSLQNNTSIRLMISDNHQNLITARSAANSLMIKLKDKKPKFVLMISSVARHKAYNDSEKSEVREVQEIVGADVPIIGYYSYSEYLNNTSNNQSSIINNGSMILFAITE